ncbi:MFS transporter [Lentzea pudingi]|uniref:MFS transporter n=1 Tax=Lentzea pudingi TaxID=1789439 RepID=A0ABQ2HC17_9PSEU|nr:MFS transporter [Lentzea pudingi]GGM73205.1 MFS transporter [Lentzea pudingi]
MLLPSLGISIANVGLPTIAVAFNAAFGVVQWVVIAYLLAVTTLVVGLGRLGDLLGRRRLLLGGITTFTLATLLCGMAPTLPVLIAGRALQGVGAACMMALAMAFVGEMVPKGRTGRVMGLLGTMSAIGTALGPSLGGALIALSGWRAIFLVCVPLGVLALVLAHRVLPESAPGSGRFDVVGTVVLGITLGAYALAVTVDKASTAVVLLVVAAVGTGVFLVVERRVTSPLVDLTMVRDPILIAGLTTNALVSTVMMATLVVGPFHLVGALGLNPALVGLAMSAGPVVSALTGVPVGRAADRFGSATMVVIGLGGVISGSAVLAVMPAAAGVTGYVLPLVVVTASYALFQAANNTAVMSNVPARRRGVVSGTLHLSRNLGLMTGASVMGAVFAFAAGTGEVTTAAAAEIARGTRWTFGVAAVLVACGLAVAVGLRRRSGSPVS